MDSTRHGTGHLGPLTSQSAGAPKTGRWTAGAAWAGSTRQPVRRQRDGAPPHGRRGPLRVPRRRQALRAQR